MYTLFYEENKLLPKLSWISELEPKKNKNILVTHGSAVECMKDWMVEGVWDGNFEDGNFHRSENFFGSGLRIENDTVHFVPSTSLTDRLFLASDNDKIYVSNSLVLILTKTGARLDENHDYKKESLPFINGFNSYDKSFKVIHHRMDKIYQVFFSNILINKDRIEYVDKKCTSGIFSFSQYIGFIENFLKNLQINFNSKNRKNKIFPITTISQGYDSTAVSSLVKNIGVSTCFTGHYIDRPFPLNRLQKRLRDDGSAAAIDLGLKAINFCKDRSSISENELYFLAICVAKFSKYSCFESAFHTLSSYIEQSNTISIVFTGCNGDHIWSTNPPFLSNNMIHRDVSGLPLAEIRLKSGFFNIPIPYILAGSLIDIVNISNSSDMDPWRLNNSYDRPIPRRIAEEAGVQRRNFGMKKLFIADRYYLPINKKLRKEFLLYLKESKSISTASVYASLLLYNIAIWLRIQLTKRGLFYRPERSIMKLLGIDFSFLMSQWAINKLINKTKEIL